MKPDKKKCKWIAEMHLVSLSENRRLKTTYFPNDYSVNSRDFITEAIIPAFFSALAWTFLLLSVRFLFSL